MASLGNPFKANSNPVNNSLTGLFGETAQQPAVSNPFGTSTQQQPQQSTSSLFDRISQPQQQQPSNPFGGSTQQQPANQNASSLFGGSTLLGSNANQQQKTDTGNPFGRFGGSLAQPQQGSSWLGGNANQQQDGNTFAGSTQSAQQQQQGQQHSSILQAHLFPQPNVFPRPRKVQEQIDVAFAKWNPQSPTTPFQTYLYNSVPPDQAPFFSPGPQDDEEKWEEALRKRPSPGAVPVMVRGFEHLALRMGKQYQHLLILQGRLHEINDGLAMLLRKHDLDISTRAAECRRRHLKLSQTCLRLAAKSQIAKNRGYAMDTAEEGLRKQLLTLERSVFDPALNGRGEEIWARMVSVRERGRQLQREYERAGKSVVDGSAGREIDEEVLKRASKILEDYHQQLSHLMKELTQIQQDFADWEGGNLGMAR